MNDELNTEETTTATETQVPTSDAEHEEFGAAKCMYLVQTDDKPYLREMQVSETEKAQVLLIFPDQEAVDQYLATEVPEGTELKIVESTIRGAVELSMESKVGLASYVPQPPEDPRREELTVAFHEALENPESPAWIFRDSEEGYMMLELEGGSSLVAAFREEDLPGMLEHFHTTQDKVVTSEKVSLSDLPTLAMRMPYTADGRVTVVAESIIVASVSPPQAVIDQVRRMADEEIEKAKATSSTEAASEG